MSQPQQHSHALPSNAPSSTVVTLWRDNLAIMAGSSVPGAESAIIKLGDRLWQERHQVHYMQNVKSELSQTSLLSNVLLLLLLVLMLPKVSIACTPSHGQKTAIHITKSCEAYRYLIILLDR